MNAVTILGSTGTIGVNTLDVIGRHPGRYEVFALSANRNVAGLLEQCHTWRPRYAVMVEQDAASEVRRASSSSSRLPSPARWRDRAPVSASR